MYRIDLTEEDWRTILFAGCRYGWSDALIRHAHPAVEDGYNAHELSESGAWAWCDAVDGDMEGGHDAFPLLDPRSELAAKLADLYQSIV